MTAHTVVYSPIGQSSRAEQIAERLSNAIVAGLLETEEQLPNEAELSRLMGVSPVTIREALNTLRARGLIDTRRGRNGGSFVCRLPERARQEHHPLRLASSDGIADLGELHAAIIGHSALLAGQRSTARDQERLASLIADFAQASQPEARAQADMRCLLTLATQAQSARLANQALAIQAEWAPLAAALYHDSQAHAATVQAYGRILAALAADDGMAARDAAQGMLAALTAQMLDLKLRLRDPTSSPPTAAA